MRKPASVAILAALFLSPATALAGPPPPPALVSIMNTNKCFFLGPNGNVAIGQGVQWSNTDNDKAHKVTEREAFWTFTVPKGGDVERIMHAAGSFVDRCDTEAFQTDSPVRVPVKAPSSTSSTKFTVTWADSSAPSTLKYNVRFAVGTSKTFHRWKSGTTARSAVFTGKANTTYTIEAASIKAGKTTDWSPPKKVSVK